MAMRITQNLLYSNSINGMNNTLNALVESNTQSASQLKINRPSDDPTGAGRVVSLKATLSNLTVYQNNIDAAKGWLATADSTLTGSSGSVQTILVRMQELTEQGATGTYDSENREQIAYELRELYKQLINLANTEYNGKHIFSGQKTGAPAYEEALGVTAIDSSGNLDGVPMTAEGGTDYTVLIQALTTDDAENATYRYTADGGKHWTEIPAADVSLDAAAGTVTIYAGGVSLTMPAGTQVTAVDTENENSTDNGTWLYVRPTAVYKGDDNDTQVTVPYGSSTNTSATVNASGSFSRDVTIRIDDDSGSELVYSYSTDDGNTWIQSTSPFGPPARLSVPGGYLTLDNTPAGGEQYVIHPHRANITLDISSTDSITLNLVGKDVFGGIYNNPATGATEVVDNSANIFETVGKLIAAAETNSQQGMQEALDELNACMDLVLTKAAVVGGRENRLEMTEQAIIMRTYDEEDNLSRVQDVDTVELSIRLAKEQIAYQSVLKSSSMIMQMSLLNFV